MYAIIIVLLALALTGCKEENITQILGPEDWQGPVVAWRTQPDPELRGAVGIDFTISDSSEIASVTTYLDGFPADLAGDVPHRLELITDSLADGVHVLEVRATDEFGNLGISPILRINVANSVAQGPQLIWVPDYFARIQDAINAATDFDTIRVRSGTYYETLNTFGKGLWLESELGPTTCSVNANGANNCFFCPASDEVVTIRGFGMTGGTYLSFLANGSRVGFYNNILSLDSVNFLLIVSYSNAIIVNNLFSGSNTAVQIGYQWGTFYNNVLQFATDFALWNASLSRNPVEYGYNLFWQNHQDYQRFEPGQGDLYDDPLLDLENRRLLTGSPALDAGNPSISDRDGTNSDIGPFGGPFAYQ